MLSSQHPPPESTQHESSPDPHNSSPPAYSQDVASPWDPTNHDAQPARPKSRGKRLENDSPAAMTDNAESASPRGEINSIQIHGSNSNNVNSTESDWKVWQMLPKEDNPSEDDLGEEDENWNLGKASNGEEMYELSDHQQQALLELELIQSGYLADLPEYDVSDRIKKLNEQLEKDETPVDDSSREIKVNFKEELVDLVAPPPDYESDFTEDDVPDVEQESPLVWRQDKIDQITTNEIEEEPVDERTSKDQKDNPTSSTDNSQSSTTSSRTKELTVESPLSEDRTSHSESVSPDDEEIDDYTDPQSSDESESDSTESESESEGEIDDYPNDNRSNKMDRIDLTNNHALDESNHPVDDKTNHQNNTSEKPPDPKPTTSDAKESNTSAQRVSKEEVVVERDGKFIVVAKDDMEARDLPSFFKDDLDTDRDMSLNGTFSGTASVSLNDGDSRPNLTRHSKSSPPSNSRSFSPSKSVPLKRSTRPLVSRSHSAQGDSRRDNKTNPEYSRPVTASSKNRDNYKSPYGLSDEEKKKRMKIQREKEQKLRREQEEIEERKQREKQSNEQAFQAWLQSKREDAARKRENGDSRSNKSDSSRKDKNESYFEEWLKSKKAQKKKEKAIRELEIADFKASLLNRSQQDCDKAFQKWLRRKNIESKENEKREKQKQRLARLSMRQSRKSQALARAIQQANAIHSLEYFGYRS